jgi:hypothetical protein
VPESPPIAELFAQELSSLAWVTDLWVSGSVATGDYRPGVSDLDLVAVVDGPLLEERRAALEVVHRRLDEGPGAGLDLGCVYVSRADLLDLHVPHPTWTHGAMVERILSGITRAELVLHGYALFGREPAALLPPVGPDDVREAARAEVTGYWAWAARRPRLWLDPVIADLGLTSMARGRHALATGTLLTKTEAIEQADAPTWLVEQLRARRRGDDVASPRLRTALLAWRDARRTVRLARR